MTKLCSRVLVKSTVAAIIGFTADKLNRLFSITVPSNMAICPSLVLRSVVTTVRNPP